MADASLNAGTPAENHDPGPAGSGLRHALTRRRALARIGTASAVATAGIAPAALACEPEPIIPLVHEFLRVNAGEGYPADDDDGDAPEVDAYMERWAALLARIAETPATTPAGAVLKYRVVLREIEEGQSRYAEAIAAGLLVDLERLAGSATHA